MATILDQIIATKRREINVAKTARPECELRAALANAPPVRDFLGALAARNEIALIAEIKKASPSKGIIRPDFKPLEIAHSYQQNGATCLSVLTDEQYFQGHLDILRQVRSQVTIPILRKDFILDTYQLLEARVAGADAVLLIAECLDDCFLRKLHNEALELGMTPLIEFYEPANLSRVVDTGSSLIGVNNRDLRTFSVDLDHTIRMRQQIPEDRLVVAESGIHSHDDLVRLERAGVNAVLVGEHLMSSPDIGRAVRQLLGH